MLWCAGSASQDGGARGSPPAPPRAKRPEGTCRARCSGATPAPCRQSGRGDDAPDLFPLRIRDAPERGRTWASSISNSESKAIKVAGMTPLRTSSGLIGRTSPRLAPVPPVTLASRPAAFTASCNEVDPHCKHFSTSARRLRRLFSLSAAVVLADWLNAEVLTSAARRAKRADQLKC
jgi:hypothetical protein